MGLLTRIARCVGAASLPLVVACGGEEALDGDLWALIDTEGLAALSSPPAPPAAKVALGRALFFDKILSGNRDVACATCHHPTLGTGDELSVSIGTGGEGLGEDRRLGAGRSFIPRNAPEIYNRGHEDWTTMFWDMRVAFEPYDGLQTPAGENILSGLEGGLAAQAMFPPTSPDEMRGKPGDIGITGRPNELAKIASDALPEIWRALTARLLDLPDYRALFAEAYPDTATEAITFAHAANAIAAFEIDAFTLIDAPWDRYLRGDHDALSDDQKAGALLFFGKAACSSCHSGPLLTDQKAHCIATPQIGPGKGEEAPFDWGRARESGDDAERYAFRTPPLRNVELTGPWMHSGAYTDLEAAVQHHLNPAQALLEYDSQQLRPELEAMFQRDAELEDAMLAALDPEMFPTALDELEVSQLISFLRALTDPQARALEYTIPATVPSGLSVDR